MSGHFTAVLEVSKTTTTTETRDRYDKVTTAATRDVAEIGRVVIRAESLETLVGKIKAHAALLVE